MDVSSAGPYPACQLSNFAVHPFEFDGVHCSSMEGFLQGLKFDCPSMQAYVCAKIGVAAKRAGAHRNHEWTAMQTLWWKGRQVGRHSEDYQLLLCAAYDAMFAQNAKFVRALVDSGDESLEHSIGRSDPTRTVLTAEEFCRQLLRLRALARGSS